MGRELRSHWVRVCKAGDGSCQWFGRRSRQIVRSVGAASSPPGRLFLVRTSCCFCSHQRNVFPLILCVHGKLNLSKCVKMFSETQLFKGRSVHSKGFLISALWLNMHTQKQNRKKKTLNAKHHFGWRNDLNKIVKRVPNLTICLVSVDLCAFVFVVFFFKEKKQGEAGYVSRGRIYSKKKIFNFQIPSQP